MEDQNETLRCKNSTRSMFNHLDQTVFNDDDDDDDDCN